MNGSEAALIEYARRSHEAAERAANSAMRAERFIDTAQREMAELRREMRQGFEALNAALVIRPPLQSRHVSLTEEDWEDSPTGSHKIVDRRVFEAWYKQHEMSEAAKKWQTLWRRVRGFVWAALGAGGGMAIEQLVKWMIGK